LQWSLNGGIIFEFQAIGMNREEEPGKHSASRKTFGHYDQIHPKFSLEPVFLLFILMLSIFLGEAFIMIVWPNLFSPRIFGDSIIDALLLLVIVFPILYLFSFRPLQSHIKELNRLQEELQRGEERYRSLVESTEDSIYLIDKDYRYLFMNKRHQSRMGLEESQFMGRLYREFHSPEGAEEFEKMIDRVFETGRSIQQEHKSHRDNRYFLRTYSPIKNRFGMVEAITVVSKDVTNLK
jgi:PAS domain S-box-containing protein